LKFTAALEKMNAAGFWGFRMKNALTFVLVVLVVAVLGFVFFAKKPEPEKAVEPPYTPPSLAAYEAMAIPADNPMTLAKVELGKQLYYDKRLSGDGTLACYSCHLKENGLTDGKPTAIGAFGVDIKRAAPTMWNIGYHKEWYWDGRAKTLEGQAKAAWSGGNMGATGKDGKPSMDDICGKLNQIAGYKNQFQKVFASDCTPDNVSKALAAFMRTIVSDDSAWVHFKAGHGGFSEAAQRGYEIFKGKARCENCHSGLLLTDLQYHNTGIGMKAKEPDLGRYRVTSEERDKGAFKTPTLLDISKSAPYFHDGSVATLEEAVDLMLRGGIDNPWLDKANLRPPVKLTRQEREDLLAFLRALDVTYKVTEPKLPQ
jgi:cytochrome c peroxidase